MNHYEAYLYLFTFDHYQKPNLSGRCHNLPIKPYRAYHTWRGLHLSIPILGTSQGTKSPYHFLGQSLPLSHRITRSEGSQLVFYHEIGQSLQVLNLERYSFIRYPLSFIWLIFEFSILRCSDGHHSPVPLSHDASAQSCMYSLNDTERQGHHLSFATRHLPRGPSPLIDHKFSQVSSFG